MDRQTLHDIDGGSGETRQKIDKAMSRSRFPHSTLNPRRKGTGRRPSPRLDPEKEEDDDLDANIPWDEQLSDDGEGSNRSPARILRKSIEATTPTLIDEVDFEEDEEKEIAALEAVRLRSNAGVFFNKDESDLRRTPGAQMYKSRYNQQGLRRTPGANAKQDRGTGDESGLGFGLTLSTPVATSRLDQKVTRPPRAPSSSSRNQRGTSTSSWSLSKDSHSEERVYSPNTLRLTEDLGNLLFEDDETIDDFSHSVSQPVFGDTRVEAIDDTKEESWTAPYVMSLETSRGSRSTRNRRGKSDLRRSRGSGRNGASRSTGNHAPANTGGFLSHAKQAKPMRNVQSPAMPGTHGFEDEGFGDSQGLLNFSGAFEPPSKLYDGGFHRPIPSTAPPNMSFGVSHHSTEMNLEQGYHGASPIFGAPFQPFGSHATNLHPQFPSQSPILDGPPAINQNQPFNFPPSHVGPHVGYPMHPGPHTFMPVHHHPEQQPQQVPVPQFVTPQVWPQPHMATQFDGAPLDQSSWHGVPPTPWPMNPFPYGVAPRSDDPSYGITPPNQDQILELESGLQGNMLKGQVQGARTEVARKRNNRKNSSQKGKKIQVKNDKSHKADSSTQSFGGKVKKKQTKATTDRPSKKTTDELAALKRAELDETPIMRTQFKSFYKKLRAKASFQDAKDLATETLADTSFPEAIHWKVYLELADLAKRANKFQEARKLYQQVILLQPYANQGWLEYSKLEEDCGNMNRCANILGAGLECCELNENLLTRAIKHYEKMGNVGRARELLSRLKHVGIEKVWRVVLEGALLEARAGNAVVARRVLKYLMHHIPWYGPLYLEAYKLEKDLDRTKEALAVVERGLASIPRYGPLWFGAFQLCEQIDCSNKRFDLPKSMEMIERAANNISKEVVWKVHLEAATMLERVTLEFVDKISERTSNRNMDICRKRFAMAILSCPPNLRWKVWLSSGRMEVLTGNFDAARKLFRRAQVVVPDKGRAVALLECARLEEFVGDTELARAILAKSRSVCGNDWKVWLESVLVETRNKNYTRAIELAELGLQQHSGTGRLWALLVQLRHFEKGEEAQFEALRRALNAVPKSGEVWCEGARIHLNPFARTFDNQLARRHLLFATKFTPQFGDGFLETLKLEMIEKWLLPIANKIWESSHDKIVNSLDGNDQEGLIESVFNISCDLFSICKDIADAGHSIGDSTGISCACLDKETVQFIRKRLKSTTSKSIDMSQLQLRCINADPNYGSLWFLCCTGQIVTARKVLAQATELVFNDLKANAHFYLSAFMRRFVFLASLEEKKGLDNAVSNEDIKCADLAVQLESSQHEVLLTAPSLDEIFDIGNKKYSNEKGMDLLASTMTSSDFTSGLASLKNKSPIESMSNTERRKALYGTSLGTFC